MKKSPSLFFYDHYRCILFVASLLVIFFNNPSLFLAPRLWMEEGSIYLSYALTHSFFDSLTATHQGYLSLWPNLATAISYQLAALENIPYITFLFALIAQILPIFLVLKLDGDGIFHSVESKSLSILAILFIPLAKEIWLSTHTSQFFFLLSTSLILTSWHKNETSEYILKTSTLIFAGLTGVLSCLLTPVFWLTYYKTKRNGTLYYAIVMTALTCMQFFIVIFSQKVLRDISFDPSIYFSAFFIRDLLTPLIGWSSALSIGDEITLLMAHPMHHLWITSLLTSVFCGLWFLLLKEKETQNKAFFLCFLIVTLFCVIFSLGEKRHLLTDVFGHRYFYVPNVLLCFCLINSLIQKKVLKKDTPSAIGFLFIAFLFMGFSDFLNLHQRSEFYTKEETLLIDNTNQKDVKKSETFYDGDNWSQEIRSYRARITTVRPIRLHPRGWLLIID